MGYRFFRKYAGGTLRDTLSRVFPSPVYFMLYKINLNAEFREWLKVRQRDVLGEKPENIHQVEFNVHEAKEDIIRSFYDYQLLRGWPAIAQNTGDVVGYDESAIRKFFRRKH